MVVVVLNVLSNRLFQFLETMISMSVVYFLLQQPEEVFHHAVVKAGPLPGHALENPFALEATDKGRHLISPSLIGMEGATIRTICGYLYSLFQCRQDSLRGWPFRETVADNLAIVQIEERIEIGFPCYDVPFGVYLIVFEFRGVRCDFLMRDAGVEPAVQPIGCNTPHGTFVGIVFATLVCKRRDLKPQFLNQTLHPFSVDHDTGCTEFPPDTAVTVIRVALADRFDFLFQRFILRRSVETFLPIHVCRFGELDDSKDVFQFEGSSEAVDDPCFLFCASSARRSLLDSFK